MTGRREARGASLASRRREEKVKDIIANGEGSQGLQGIGIESCGESPIPLDGFVRQLHQANLVTLYNQLVG